MSAAADLIENSTTERMGKQDRYLSEVRAFLTPRLQRELEQGGRRLLLEVFTLLRRLRPGDVRTASLCHRVLLREARHDIQEMGFIDVTWGDLSRLVYNTMDSQGYHFRDGRWEPNPSWPPQPAKGKGLS